MNDENDQPPVGTKWLFCRDHGRTQTVTFIAQVVQLSLLQSKETGKVMQDVCLCRKSSNHSQHQPPFSRFRLIVQKSHSPDYSVADACPPASRVVHKGLQRVDIGSRGKILKIFKVQHPICPIVMGATGNSTARHPGGAPFTDTRIPVDTHRMSNCSFVRPAFSRIVRKKIACASFHGLLSGAVSSVPLTCSPLTSIGARTKAC